MFVVHRHEATRLHYDLRLEMNGVLKCFAIPKGFSHVPEEKHLAVRTEDHPLEYQRFEGVIPKGEYGAGVMTIWDLGPYRLAKNADGVAGLDAGKLELILYGGRLRGEWHLVKIKKSERDWLLFKSRDRYARSREDPLFPLDLSRVPRSSFPKRFRAMHPQRAERPFTHPDWIFELKFVGQRLIASVHGEQVRFFDQDGKLFAAELREVSRDLRRLRAERALIDGVLVALDNKERPDKNLLGQKLSDGVTSGLTYYVFDILYFEDWNLRRYSLTDRKHALASILVDLETVLYVDHINERGDELFEVVKNCGLPGVIAKKLTSHYRGGASNDWRFVPAPAKAEKQDDDKGVLERLATQPRPKRTTRVRITNRSKVYWPQEGITKGQLLEYYDHVADILLPYLRDRPIHTLRYPDGIDGPSFYHKNLTGQIPNWIETVQVRGESDDAVRYVVCNDRDTLLYLVNLASIDLHPWMSRSDRLDCPDWAIIDLDPSKEDFSAVVRVARAVGKVLRSAGLRPLLKTSGASGLHVYIPVEREYTYDQTRMFCEIVARIVVRDHGDIATVERTVARRGGRVYVDFMQNRREQTVVPPYVVRPLAGATVSAPLEWDELNSELHPSQFTIHTIHARINRLGDLFRGALDDPQDLKPAIDALSGL